VPLPLAAARRLYADADTEDLAERPTKARTRFGGLSPSEGATLPPLTYWDEAKTLPRSNMGGCVGLLVGQYGSHKTGTAIMLALDAIQRHDARVLFIAAEDANGVAKDRLPAACKARGIKLADLDAHWRTETETFDLLSETDRADMIDAYADFAPDLIFIDVLTRVVAADINAPETGMRVMQAVYALAAPFGATVVIAHHPGLNSSGRPMGSSLFTSLADFCLTAIHKDGVVSTKVEKMKNGGHAERLERAEEISVLLARHHADEATQPQPRAEQVGAGERRAEQCEETIEEAMILNEIARYHRVGHGSGEQLFDEAMPHGIRSAVKSMPAPRSTSMSSPPAPSATASL
jgi:hypothetical protein